MKQLILNPRSGKYETVEVPAPQVHKGHVLVRLRASVVSAGTEKTAISFAEKNLVQKAYSRPDLVKQVYEKVQRDGLLSTIEGAFARLEQPMALGYSCAGVVIAVGEGVSGFAVGDVVACAGAYAAHCEVAAVPEILCANLMPFSSAPDAALIETSAFATLGAIALQGIRLAQVQVGETCAVIGLGLIGQIAVQLLKAAGCRVIGMDVAPARAALAKRLGADATASSASEMQASVSKLSAGRGADSVLITAATSSDEPLHMAAEIARDRAIVVPVGAVGLNVPRRLFYEKELDLRISRSYGPGRYDPSYEEQGNDYPIGYVRWTENRNMVAFLQLAAEGKLDLQPLVTHRFPIERAAEAYDLLLGKTQEPFMAILLEYAETSRRAQEHRVTLAVSRSSRAGVAPAVKAGVIGAGNFANATLLPALRRTPGVQLVGVATKHGLSSRYTGGKFGFAYCTSSEEELLNDPGINTVFILTRHHLHASQTIAALQAGKHVFVEKPLALNRDELEKIAATARQRPEQMLMVGYNRRFARLAIEMKAFMARSAEPLMLHYRVNAGLIPASHWIHDPAQGGGRVLGEACHFIDFANWMIGECATRVEGSALPDLGRYRGDNVVIRLGYPNGSLAVITYVANGDRSMGKERIEAHSAGSSAVLDDFWRLECARDGHRQSRRVWLRQDKGHLGECVALANALRSGGPAPIPLRDLVAGMAATFAAAESIRGGSAIHVELQPKSTDPDVALGAAN